MDRSDVCFLRSKGDARETPRVVTRRSLLAGAGGLAMLAKARPGFAGTSAANDLDERRTGTMDIKRNGSRPSGKGPEAWFTGTVRVDPVFQVGDPTHRSGGQSYFRARCPHDVAHPSARSNPHRHVWPWLGAKRGRIDRRNPSRRRHLVSTRREALARRDSDDRDDAYRHYGIAQRQERRLDGKGQRRPIPQVIGFAIPVPTCGRRVALRCNRRDLP